MGTLLEMADKKYRAGVERYEYIFEQLERLKVKEMVRLQDYMVDDDLEMNENGGVCSKRMKSLENIFQKFEYYCKELAVFGFNSAGYDIKSIKKYLFKELCGRGQQPNFTVKKAGKYPCIKTNRLKFMDILQFLVLGYNLKSFFKAFGVSEQKGFFPYDYFTHADQPDEANLPPYETFYSTIKNCNVPEEEYASFQKLLDQRKSEQEAYNPCDYQQNQKPVLKIISGFNNYGLKINGQLLLIFSNGIMIWMIQAIENMNEFYKNICIIRIDFIHQAISISGVAMRVCFNSITDPAAEFHLFNPKNRDIYRLFKENIVSGPSIIFN